MKKNFKYKIRLISVIILLLIFNVGITIDKEIEHNVELDFNSTEYFYVIAKDGDTIWNIVKSNYNNIEKPRNMDFRDLVLITMDLNDGHDISIGQSVKLPKNVK